MASRTHNYHPDVNADVRQKQTFALQKCHVRFTLESGHVRRELECPLSARSGHRVSTDAVVTKGNWTEY